MYSIQNCHIHEYRDTRPWPRCGSETKRYKAAAGPLGSNAKKSITRKWLSTTPPTVEDWYGIILNRMGELMEKFTYSLRTQKHEF